MPQVTWRNGDGWYAPAKDCLHYNIALEYESRPLSAPLPPLLVWLYRFVWRIGCRIGSRFAGYRHGMLRPKAAPDSMSVEQSFTPRRCCRARMESCKEGVGEGKNWGSQFDSEVLH